RPVHRLQLVAVRGDGPRAPGRDAVALEANGDYGGNGLTQRNRETEKVFETHRRFFSVTPFLCVDPFPPCPPLSSETTSRDCAASLQPRRAPRLRSHAGL